VAFDVLMVLQHTELSSCCWIWHICLVLVLLVNSDDDDNAYGAVTIANPLWESTLFIWICMPSHDGWLIVLNDAEDDAVDRRKTSDKSNRELKWIWWMYSNERV